MAAGLRVEREGDLLHVVLDRPEVRNALDAETIARRSLEIAASLCIHTNSEIWTETLPTAI